MLQQKKDFLKKAEQWSPIDALPWTLTHSSPSSDPVTKGSDQKQWSSGDLRLRFNF